MTGGEGGRHTCSPELCQRLIQQLLIDLGSLLGRRDFSPVIVPCSSAPEAASSLPSSLCAPSSCVPNWSTGHTPLSTSCFTFSRPLSSAIWKLSTRTAITRLGGDNGVLSRRRLKERPCTLLWVHCGMTRLRGLGRGCPSVGGGGSEAGEQSGGGVLT